MPKIIRIYRANSSKCQGIAQLPLGTQRWRQRSLKSSACQARSDPQGARFLETWWTWNKDDYFGNTCGRIRQPASPGKKPGDPYRVQIADSGRKAPFHFS